MSKRTVTRCIALFLASYPGGECLAQEVYELWDGLERPYYRENDLEEHEKVSPFGVLCAYDVTQPTLTVYAGEGERSSKAVILIPGGGYSLVAVHHEGHDLARDLAARGITAAVLKYRLPRTESSSKPHLVPLEESLYHREMTAEEAAWNTLLDHVSKDTPPAFLAHAYDDDICDVKESTLYAQRCRLKEVPVEMHLFQRGGHGFGMGRKEDGTALWVPLFVTWTAGL